MRYTVTKSKSNGMWWVLDADGFEVSYVGYDYKMDAVAAMKARIADDEHEFNQERDLMVR